MSNGTATQAAKSSFISGEKRENGKDHSNVMAFDTTEASMDNYNAWNNYLRGENPVEKPKNVEVSVTPEPTEITPHELRRSMHDAEVKSVELAADVLDQIKGIQGVNEAGFAARGEMKFNSDSENTEMAFEEEITAPLPEDPGKQYLFERKEKVEEFKDNADVSRPLKLVDFGFFFSKVFGGLRGLFDGMKFKPSFKPAGKAMFDLGREEVLFKYKKPETAEEREKHAKQVANKRAFFDSLRFGRALSTDKKRSMQQQLEQTNKQAGITNVSYEGTMDDSGQILENVAIAAEKGNSQKSAEQLKQEKQKKLQLFGKGKGKSGPGISFSSDKAHNFNNAAKLAG